MLWKLSRLSQFLEQSETVDARLRDICYLGKEVIISTLLHRDSELGLNPEYGGLFLLNAQGKGADENGVKGAF